MTLCEQSELRELREQFQNHTMRQPDTVDVPMVVSESEAHPAIKDDDST